MKIDILIIGSLLTVCAVAPRLDASEPYRPCRDRGVALVVGTREHVLWMCAQDAVVRELGIAIGRGGVGKQREGDKKTPLGEYRLGVPRPSPRFGVFIPVGYPTPEQAGNGFTGGAIGIHGPDRRFKWLGRVTTWLDWTEGCIAVGTDEDIQSLAEWVRKNNVVKIFIESRL